MRRYGFKLFSDNLKNNRKMLEAGIDFVKAQGDKMFVELMVCRSTLSDIDELKTMLEGTEVRIHAPHGGLGVDTGRRELEKSNRALLAPAQYAADVMGAKTIVVHAGRGASEDCLKETIRQFKLLNDQRIVVENLPIHAHGELSHGVVPEEIKIIREETGCGFCFDFSHAVCTAFVLGCPPEKLLEGFYELQPTVYHLCDGNLDDEEDNHMHFGEGHFPLKDWLNNYVAEDAYVTMETGHGCPKDILPWVKDYEYISTI